MMMNLSATKEKIEKHRQFVSKKTAELEAIKCPYRGSLRNLRLMRMNNRVLELIMEFNREMMLSAFSCNNECEKDSNDEETTTTGGNEMKKDNLQKLIVDNFKAKSTALATKLFVEGNFPQDAILELIETSLKDEPKYDFIDFPISVRDGTGVTRLQELYMHLENGWKIERVQDNSEIDSHFYFTLVREAEEETKHMIEPAEVREIVNILLDGLLGEAPFIVSELLPNGEEVPKEVTREFYLRLHMDIALDRIYCLLEDHLDDEGKFKE